MVGGGVEDDLPCLWPPFHACIHSSMYLRPPPQSSVLAAYNAPVGSTPLQTWEEALLHTAGLQNQPFLAFPIAHYVALSSLPVLDP